MAIEVVKIPIKNGGSWHANLYQGVEGFSTLQWDWPWLRWPLIHKSSGMYPTPGQVGDCHTRSRGSWSVVVVVRRQALDADVHGSAGVQPCSLQQAAGRVRTKTKDGREEIRTGKPAWSATYWLFERIWRVLILKTWFQYSITTRISVISISTWGFHPIVSVIMSNV